MTDKEKIKQEIERRIKNLEFSLKNNCVTEYSKLDILGNITTLESLLQFIDSLPEKPASEDLENQYKSNMRCQHAYTQDDLMKTKSEDLEEELRKILNKHYYFSDEDDELRSTPELAKYIAHHFAEWQKQQMMKDALDGEYWIGEIHLDTPIIQGYDDGDIIKFIPIKEEQQ